jgi:hypothetical protein
MASIAIRSPGQKVVKNRNCLSQFCGLVYMGCPGAGWSLDVWPNPAAGWDAGSSLGSVPSGLRQPNASDGLFMSCDRRQLHRDVRGQLRWYGARPVCDRKSRASSQSAILFPGDLVAQKTPWAANPLVQRWQLSRGRPDGHGALRWSDPRNAFLPGVHCVAQARGRRIGWVASTEPRTLRCKA